MKFLKNEITFLSGIGPKKAELLNKEASIFTYKDLIYYFPFKYIDRTKFHKINEISIDLPYIQIKGRITGFKQEGQKYKKRLIATFSDNTGNINLIWFKGYRWLIDNLKLNTDYIVFGKPSVFNHIITITHPEIEDLLTFEKTLTSSLQPAYNTSDKLKNNYITSRTIQKFQQTLLKQVYNKLPETLPDYLLKQANLLSINDALLNIHFPKNNELLKKSIYRLKFEELFLIQLQLLKFTNNRNNKYKGFVFSKVSDYFNNFYHNNLPFTLTNAQKRVLKEIRKDLGSGKQMNRLLQGDVGSGKTLVALMSILIALDNGYQTCIMAPTEILATQHLNTITKLIEGLNIKCKLLTGSTKKSERKIIHKELIEGELQILIGTHAVIEDVVQFKNLGLVVIDEQHRFGVAQRAKLWKKNSQPPHVMVMTATPIPRTLALTLYGDLDVSIIDELPPGRKAIQTIHYFDSHRLKLFGFVRREIKAGKQVYFVYPLIKESEKMDYKDLEDGFEGISRAFPLPEYTVSIVHGKMKNDNKNFEMKRFQDGKTNIMVSTTVIEVGVDIPNASVMVIESAEKFGLSQLHQLRGRVGRGADQSYCVLMTSFKLTNEAKKRIDIMVSSNDGFEIAEADLKLRGPGDMEGTQQSGIAFDLKISNLAKDGQIVQYARDIADKIIKDDPKLEKQENQILQFQLEQQSKSNLNWGDIS